MTAHDYEAFLQSMADWVSPGPSSPLRHHDDAGKEIADKVVLLDTDHLWGHTGGDNIWAWRTFMRGMNPLFMEELSASPTWQDSARRGMGQRTGGGVQQSRQRAHRP